MIRATLGAVLVVLLSAGGIQAAEVKGKVVSVDAEKNTITIKADDKEQTLAISPEVKVVEQTGKGKKVAETAVADGLKGVKTGAEVTLTSLPSDEKVVRIRIDASKKKKKDKK